jgi:hypothetical protein
LVSKHVRLTWLYELPTVVPDLMKGGYNVFHFEVDGEKKRVLLNAWKKVDRARRFECLGTETEGCGQRYLTKRARSMHQVAAKHSLTKDHPVSPLLKREQAEDVLQRLETITEGPVEEIQV